MKVVGFKKGLFENVELFANKRLLTPEHGRLRGRRRRLGPLCVVLPRFRDELEARVIVIIQPSPEVRVEDKGNAERRQPLKNLMEQYGEKNEGASE